MVKSVVIAFCSCVAGCVKVQLLSFRVSCKCSMTASNGTCSVSSKAFYSKQKLNVF